jgi:hypothetical protein
VKVLTGSEFVIIGLVLTAFGFPSINGSELSYFLFASFIIGANLSPPTYSTVFAGSFSFFSLIF